MAKLGIVKEKRLYVGPTFQLERLNVDGKGKGILFCKFEP